MIGYVLVGTNDLSKATSFYDALLPTIGGAKLFERPDGGRMYSSGPDQVIFGVVPPYDGNQATVANGGTIGLKADTRAQVDNVHSKALELGGSDEGAPGVRGAEGDGAFYAAYFRDLDGNKFCVFRIGPP